MIIYNFLQAGSVAEKGLNATPYSSAIYGILVFILIIISYKLWQKHTEKGEQIIQVAQKAIGAINMVESRLEEMVQEIRSNNKSVDELERRISSLEEKTDKNA